MFSWSQNSYESMSKIRDSNSHQRDVSRILRWLFLFESSQAREAELQSKA